jgi:hypothetical protein
LVTQTKGKRVIILSLDVSTKTGYACVEYDEDGIKKIHDMGVLEQIPQPKGFSYPLSYVVWANIVYGTIVEKVLRKHSNASHLVVEETAKGSKDNMSQKILEFIHFQLANYVDPYIDMGSVGPREHPYQTIRYFMTEEWRRITGCQQNAEEKKHNAKRSRLKKKQGGTVIKDENGKRLGRVTKKHVTIRKMNEIFDLDLILKDEDIADALGLNYARYMELKDAK